MLYGNRQTGRQLNREEILKVKKLRQDGIPWSKIEKEFGINNFILRYYIKTLDKN